MFSCWSCNVYVTIETQTRGGKIKYACVYVIKDENLSCLLSQELEF